MTYFLTTLITLSRAELGRATWKLLHTMMARFPDKPSLDERTALRTYIHLFARLYPWYAPFSLPTPNTLLISTIVVNVQNISSKSSTNIPHKCLHARLPQLGPATFTMRSISPSKNPYSIAHR